MNMRAWLDSLKVANKRVAMPILSFPSIQLQDITVKELVYSSELQAKGMAAIAARCPSVASVSMMDLSVEAECFGSPIRVSDDEVPTVVAPILESIEDAEALQVPAVGTGRTGVYLEAIEKALALITDRPVFAGVIGPFSLAGRLMDMTEIMCNCYDEPEFVHLTLEKVTAFLIDYIGAYKKIGAHGVMIAEPAAGLLSPDLCGEFSSPYVKRIVDALQDENFLIIYHNCGPAVLRMSEEILETGAAAYHFGNAVSMAAMLEKMPQDTVVMGNIDPVGVLRNGTPESVRTAVRALLDECGAHPNFLLSSGCDIPPVTPWENIDAFFSEVG